MVIFRPLVVCLEIIDSMTMIFAFLFRTNEVVVVVVNVIIQGGGRVHTG